MNEEYLFNKTGEDAEIRHLEETLAAFRYRESDPPPLPLSSVRPHIETKRSFNWRLSFAFALPALAVLVAAGAVWIRSAAPDTTETPVVFIAAPEFRTETPAAPVPVKKSQPLPSAPGPAPKRQRSTFAPVLTARATRTRPKRRTRVDPPGLTTFAGLSKKERYAYEQLMLALSISGSRLRIVKDAVNGNEAADRNAGSRR